MLKYVIKIAHRVAISQ